MIQPIRILSLDLELLGEIDNYLSLSFCRRYHAPGEFELVTNRKAAYANRLEIDNLIMLGTQNRKVGIIRYKEIKATESGEEILTIKGFTLEAILRQRITIPPTALAYDVQEANAETVMKHYVQRNCLDIPEMMFPSFAVATDQGRGVSVLWQSRYKNLADELEQISLGSGLGWNLLLDLSQRQWVFDVVDGQNRTVNQQGNAPVIFSPDFENIQSQEYCESTIHYGNYAVVAGTGEGEQRVIQPVGSSETGFQRHVFFVDARDVDGSIGLLARGAEQLMERQPVRSFQSEMLSGGPFQYQRDWDVGDVVTIQNKAWNITMDSRITEVTEIYESAGVRLFAVFGNNIPTVYKSLRSEIGRFSQVITR